MPAPARLHSCVYSPEEVDCLRAVVRETVRDHTRPQVSPENAEQIARRVFGAYSSGVCQYVQLLWVASVERRRLERLRLYRSRPAVHGSSPIVEALGTGYPAGLVDQRYRKHRHLLPVRKNGHLHHTDPPGS
jgi:hypothetical protein